MSLRDKNTEYKMSSTQLNEPSVSSVDAFERNAAGNHVIGALTVKLRWPVEVRIRGIRRTPDTVERDVHTVI